MRVLTVVLGLAIGLSISPASAGRYVSIEDVRAMAFERGIVRLKEVELDDGIWEVEGKDEFGHEIEMEVEARTGRVIKMKRD